MKNRSFYATNKARSFYLLGYYAILSSIFVLEFSGVEFGGGDKSVGKVQGNGKSGIWTFEECSTANNDFESEADRTQSVSNRRF